MQGLQRLMKYKMNMRGGGDAVRKRRQESPLVETSREDIQPTSKSAGWTLLAQLILTLISLPFVYVLYILIATEDVIKPKELNLDAPPALTGNLALNTVLQNAERLYEGKIEGPESIVYNKGNIYTGTADGKVIVIEDGVLKTVATFGKQPCGGFDNEPHCGRPLGMRFDSQGYLIVLDAYLGMFKLNVVTGDYTKYISSDTLIDGAKPKFLNDLDIHEDGTIYFTDTSTKWNRNQYVMPFMEGENSGRLIKYDPKSNSTEVLVTGLHFPNGVQIARNGEYLLFAETMFARIWKYHIKGSRKGEVEIFIDNLPGLPDNIRKCYSGGGYWVALPLCRNAESFSLSDFIFPKLWLRSFAAKAFSSSTLLSITSNKCGRIIQIDNDGNIVRTLHDSTGKSVFTISEVEDHQGTLYLGSYKAPFIGKIKL